MNSGHQPYPKDTFKNHAKRVGDLAAVQDTKHIIQPSSNWQFFPAISEALVKVSCVGVLFYIGLVLMLKAYGLCPHLICVPGGWKISIKKLSDFWLAGERRTMQLNRL